MVLGCSAFDDLLLNTLSPCITSADLILQIADYSNTSADVMLHSKRLNSSAIC